MSIYAFDPTPFVVVSRLASYPDRLVWSDLLELLEQPTVSSSCRSAGSSEVWDSLRLQINLLFDGELRAEDLAARYIDLFDRGVNDNSLYETEHGIRRSQLKTHELADIAGFYQAFGFRLNEDSNTREMLDHLAVESEFYALLLAKQQLLHESGDTEGEDIVLDARKKFLQDHLGRFPRAIANRPGIVADSFYSQVFNWCAEVVENECARLNVAVVPVDYDYSSDQEEAITCGGVSDLITSIGGKAIG